MRLSEIRRQRGKIQPLSKRKKGCPEVSAASGGYSEPEGLGCERGTTFEQSENGAASTLPPAGATTGRAVSRSEMEPNGDKRRGFAVGAPARRSRDGNGKTSAPVGPVTGQPGFAAGEMRLNGSKGRRRSVRLKKSTEYELYSLY